MLSFRGNFFLVFFNFCDVVFSNRNVVDVAEVVVYGSPRHALGLFEDSETLEEFAVCFVVAQFVDRGSTALAGRPSA